MCVCVCVCVWCARMLSSVQLFATPWTIAHQGPLSMEFSRQEYWSRLPFPPLGDLLDLEIKPASLASPALAGRFFTTCTTWEALLKWSCPFLIYSLHHRWSRERYKHCCISVVNARTGEEALKWALKTSSGESENVLWRK